MYETPHLFAVDIPRILSEVRRSTYLEYAWPRRIARAIWTHPYLAVAAASVAGCAAAIGTALSLRGGGALFSPHTQPGAFYAVIPWLAMVVPAMFASVFVLAVLGGAIVTFWRSAGQVPATAMVNPRVWVGAFADALRLRNLVGGGPGCPYPNERPSHLRRWLHHLVFYGFALDFASTVSAAVYQDAFGLLPPYALISLPVVLGSFGGIGLIVGCSGLLYLRFAARKARGERSNPQATAFLIVLDLVALTGMSLLFLRGTVAMGGLLVAHLATLFALYFTLPYGQFVHGAYRIAALFRNRIDQVGAADQSSEVASSQS